VSEEYSRAFYDIQLKEIRKNMKVVITRVKGERVIARETYVKNFSQLIKDWETNTGLKWPVDKGGTRLQAHHFIPLESGGHNAWYNLVPLTGKFHQGNIHIPGSTLKDLFQGIGENFVVQLFE
jgi:23S rRNA-/tRNA-specific pseudouridylate synthase